MSLFQWQESLSVGDAAVDADHQLLITGLNMMHDAMLAGRGKEVVGAILDGMVLHLKEHIAREEALWKRIDYAGLAEHKKEHEECLRLAGDLYQLYKAGEVALVIDVMTFMQNRLFAHMVNQDKKAAEAIAAAEIHRSCRVCARRRNAA